MAEEAEPRTIKVRLICTKITLARSIPALTGGILW